MKASGKIFWKNVDIYRPCSLKKLCEATGLSYQRMRDQRSRESLPALTDAYAISIAIGVTIEKLLTGLDTSDFPEDITAIAEKSLDADSDDLRLIRTILGLNSNLYTLHGDFPYQK